MDDALLVQLHAPSVVDEARPIVNISLRRLTFLRLRLVILGYHVLGKRAIHCQGSTEDPGKMIDELA